MGGTKEPWLGATDWVQPWTQSSTLPTPVLGRRGIHEAGRPIRSHSRLMNIVRSGPVLDPHHDFTTGAPCVVPPACDAQGARTGRACTNTAVQWQDVENPNLLLHAHVCQEHRALSGTSADRQPNDSHSVLYRTLVHPLVFLLVGVIVVTKVLGLW